MLHYNIMEVLPLYTRNASYSVRSLCHSVLWDAFYSSSNKVFKELIYNTSGVQVNIWALVYYLQMWFSLKLEMKSLQKRVMVLCCSLVVELITPDTFSCEGRHLPKDAIFQCRIGKNSCFCSCVFIRLKTGTFSGVQEYCLNQTKNSVTPSWMCTAVLK